MAYKWVEEELETIDIGDKRLNERVKYLLTAASKKPLMSINRMFHTRKEMQAAYRFFDNDLVNEEKIFFPHLKKTHERISQYPVVLCLSDTTSLNYTTRKKQLDSGYISSNNAQGFFLHATIAITPDRMHLGVVQQQFWARDKVKTKKVHRDLLPIEEKESFRWLEAYANTCKISETNKNTKVVHITDREGDIIEILSEYQSRKDDGTAADFIIRSNHNRVISSEDKTTKKLYDKLNKEVKLGEISFEIINRDTSEKRKVHQSVKAASVIIKSKEKSKADIMINAIFLEEIDPPTDVKPVMWYLITSLPISNVEEIKTIIQYYLSRWEVEVFFKTYKSGCKVEEKSLRNAKRLFPLFALLLIVAWRLNYLLHMSRVVPEIICDIFFEESEWKAGYVAATRDRQVPQEVPTLEKMMFYIAKLGGYLERKKDPKPGIKSFWLGLVTLSNYADAWDLFGPGAESKREI